ncbi:MAG: purine-nucleoside phosphorylase [Bacteroidales bacterium]|jgi:purine-nucleoside phosphorylase|nr:purine-nucleoside phosphorylase [Bacteroidales bacterium]
MNLIERAKETAVWLQQKLGEGIETAIILGSGLGDLADDIRDAVRIPYKDIPYFPVSTAIGHKGNLVCGMLGNKKVLAMQGRFHYYEGYMMQEVTFPIRVFSFYGIKHLIVSNAAGGMNPDYHVGDLMIIKDHINLMPNPLIGQNMEELGPRFPDMTRAYDPEMIKMAEEVARELEIKIHKGVYVGSTGPTFETPAEYKYFSAIGGDVCGMSTVPEVITARHAGIRIFGMSVVSNEAYTFGEDYKNDGEDVLIEGKKAAVKMTAIVKGLINRL